MDGNKEERSNFYEILGLKKECSEAELKNAYKKLALRWHPDRCSASCNSKYLEEAKKKFQAVQEAYSVLSDANRRCLYDVGIHDNDDDDADGMTDFLNEMATMMRQNKPNENVGTSFEELKDLFEEMFQSDIESTKSFTTCPSLFSSCGESSTSINKRGLSEMSTSTFEDSSKFRMSVQGFCLATGRQHGRYKARRVCSRKAWH